MKPPGLPKSRFFGLRGGGGSPAGLLRAGDLRENAPPAPLGRPPADSGPDQQQAAYDWLNQIGPGIGVPALRQQFPAMARAERTELLRCYRELWQAEHSQTRHVLRWQRPGTVWAMDFAEAPAPEGVFLKANPHPRAYGTFARLLGRYVRDERIVPLEEAIRRLTSQPAETLRLRDRGRLAPGYHADVVVFDSATVADRATFEQPHQLAVGMRHVLVNGEPVLRDGEPTGATPGRVVRGPGWKGWPRR